MIIEDQLQNSILRNGDSLIDWVNVITLTREDTIARVTFKNLKEINIYLEQICFSLQAIGIHLL